MRSYKIFSNLIDIFERDGWKNWSRWRNIKGTWVMVAGSCSNPNKAQVILQGV